MKKKLVLTGILAAVLVFSSMFAGCKGKGISITITGLPGAYSMGHQIVIKLASSWTDIEDNFVASGDDDSEYDGSNDAITIPLVDQNGKPWAGKGSYIIAIYTSAYYGDGVTQDWVQVYTDGKNFRELGIKRRVMEFAMGDKLPKFEFKSANVTIPYEKFITVGDDAFGEQSRINITTSSDSSDELAIVLFKSMKEFRDGYFTARGYGEENSLIRLYDEDGEPWYEEGEYFLMVTYKRGNTVYLFTNGQSFRSLGLHSNSDFEDIEKWLPKFRLKKPDNYIQLNQFRNISTL